MVSPPRVLLVAAVFLGLSASGVMAQPGAPVVVRKDKAFGRVLFTPGHKALYFWAVEKQAGRIVCTGSCAVKWPPLVVKSRSAVPARIAGVKGRFGVVRRPDGRLQVTRNGLALYTYADDPPNQVLCNNFNRWFAVRA
jgi:predicted lipoprotein with Yx(FWY)xxD motif